MFDKIKNIFNNNNKDKETVKQTTSSRDGNTKDTKYKIVPQLQNGKFAILYTTIDNKKRKIYIEGNEKNLTRIAIFASLFRKNERVQDVITKKQPFLYIHHFVLIFKYPFDNNNRLIRVDIYKKQKLPIIDTVKEIIDSDDRLGVPLIYPHFDDVCYIKTKDKTITFKHYATTAVDIKNFIKFIKKIKREIKWKKKRT